MRATADSALTLRPAHLQPAQRSSSRRARGLLPLRGSVSPCGRRAGCSCCWPVARTWGAQGKKRDLPCRAQGNCRSPQQPLLHCRACGTVRARRSSHRVSPHSLLAPC